jgi:hypothetical protein
VSCLAHCFGLFRVKYVTLSGIGPVHCCKSHIVVTVGTSHVVVTVGTEYPRSHTSKGPGQVGKGHIVGTRRNTVPKVTYL